MVVASCSYRLLVKHLAHLPLLCRCVGVGAESMQRLTEMGHDDRKSHLEALKRARLQALEKQAGVPVTPFDCLRVTEYATWVCFCGVRLWTKGCRNACCICRGNLTNVDLREALSLAASGGPMPGQPHAHRSSLRL